MNKPILASKIRSAFNRSESMRDIHLGDVVSLENGGIGYYQGASNFSDPERLKVRLVPVQQPYYGPMKPIKSYFTYNRREIPVFVEYEKR